MLCRRCASRMVPVCDRDALACELCGHAVTGEWIARLRPFARWVAGWRGI